ncbi:hypothetical protein B5X24_HaOG208833 [Helicoverpa armigera]|nr:hypothetical protein B5X24_HaOG208833 [Helicoverpa armigera]
MHKPLDYLHPEKIDTFGRQLFVTALSSVYILTRPSIGRYSFVTRLVKYIRYKNQTQNCNNISNDEQANNAPALFEKRTDSAKTTSNQRDQPMARVPINLIE